MSERAFLLRARCGCAEAVSVEDDDYHYVTDVARWKRIPTATIERVSIEVAREEIGKTFARMKELGMTKGHRVSDCLRGAK